MTWQITDMPTQRGPGADYVGWLRHQLTGLHVKIQIAGDTNQENAFLIIQNLAGILTGEGLDRMLTPDGNYIEETDLALAIPLQERGTP